MVPSVSKDRGVAIRSPREASRNHIWRTDIIGKDLVKGHIQAAMELTRDFQIAADVTHDFERSGGVREDLTAEVRLTKFFIPQAEPLK